MGKLKVFFIKSAILVFPLFLIMAVYVITDPFKVIYKYHFDNYTDWQPWALSRDVAGVENLEYRLDRNDTPNAYIFGNSRSLVFRCGDWEPILNDHTRPYHFDAVTESLFGVFHKVKYLDKSNIKIKDVLLVCDVSLLSKVVNDHDMTHIKQPDVSGESRFVFHTDFIKVYFTNFFFLKQMDYLLFKKFRAYMTDVFGAPTPRGFIHTEAYTNDFYFHGYDSLLAQDSTAYYEVYKKEVFRAEKPEKEQVSEPVLKEKQIEMLKEMKRIFDKNGTRCKIVISPLYDQKKINEADIKTLTGIFGEHVVYDYSGKNDITVSEYNYYESSHYKSYIARKIMADIYSK